jgi:DivIVA domain-containing protein
VRDLGSLALDAMASMDVSPQELRDIEIREAWRGYHRDDVDELLERAAATIEHLEAENQQLRARVSQGGGPPRAPMPAPAPAAAPVVAAPAPPPVPVPAPAPAAAPARIADTDVIQRTLVLAQKAADEAVADARSQAQRIVGDAEAHSKELVNRAETRAAEIAENERRKLEEDIGRLQNARDTLNADVDALERFEQEYRDRLRHAIEAELDLLGQTSSGALERPAIHDVELPAATTTSWAAAPAAAPAEPEGSWSASQEGVVASPPAAPPTAGAPTVHIEAVPAGDAAWDPAPAGGWADAPTAGVVDDSGDIALIDDSEQHGDSLDDDAFFASLREAVRDDAPLNDGGVAGVGDDDSAFFDQDDTDEHRRLFKRRR